MEEKQNSNIMNEINMNNQEQKESKDNNDKNEESNKKNGDNKNKEKNKIQEKINSVPIMMRCFICEDYCEEPVQILCCNEIFCKKHITEEILKNFKCPNCQTICGLNNIIENKKLSEDIRWFKKLLNELIIGENERNYS